MYAGLAQQSGYLHELAAFFGRWGIDGNQGLTGVAVGNQPEISPETGIGRSGAKRGKVQPIPVSQGLQPVVKLGKAKIGVWGRHKFEG